MKDKIIEVLGSFGEQVNLNSSAAKNAIANAIVEKLNEPSRAKQSVDFGNDESKWICEYCGRVEICSKQPYCKPCCHIELTNKKMIRIKR